MNIYQFNHKSGCPNGLLKDCYDITLISNSTIMAEDILDTLKNSKNPIFQEELADHLKEQFGCSIQVIGWHFGIKITSIRQ